MNFWHLYLALLFSPFSPSRVSMLRLVLLCFFFLLSFASCHKHTLLLRSFIFAFPTIAGQAHTFYIPVFFTLAMFFYIFPSAHTGFKPKPIQRAQSPKEKHAGISLCLVSFWRLFFPVRFRVVFNPQRSL